jgi:hypothetical protein
MSFRVYKTAVFMAPTYLMYINSGDYYIPPKAGIGFQPARSFFPNSLKGV